MNFCFSANAKTPSLLTTPCICLPPAYPRRDIGQPVLLVKTGELLASTRFNKDSIAKRQHSLSQAFSFLGQREFLFLGQCKNNFPSYLPFVLSSPLGTLDVILAKVFTIFNMASEWLVSAKIGELLASDRFDKDSIVERQLSLSQAFCLLWQNERTGDVAGRQRPNAMTDSATAAVILDLYVMEKIDLEKEIKHWMDRTREIIMVKVSIL